MNVNRFKFAINFHVVCHLFAFEVREMGQLLPTQVSLPLRYISAGLGKRKRTSWIFIILGGAKNG